MLKEIITSTLFVSAIALISAGIYTGDIILALFGGIFCGIYNICVFKEKE